MNNFTAFVFFLPVFNSIINTICTLFEIRMGQFIDYEGAEKLGRQLIDEAYKLWYDFFKSSDKHLFPFNPTTHEGYISTDMSETAKGYDKKDLKDNLVWSGFFSFSNTGNSQGLTIDLVFVK